MLAEFSRFLKNYQEQVILVFVFFFFVTLPISSNLNSYTIFILVGYWVFSGSFLNYKKILNKYVILQVVFYLLFLVGFFLSEDRQHASFLLQQRLSLLVFPFLIAMLPIFKGKTIFKILILFVAVCMFYCLYALSAGMYENFYVQHLTALDIKFFFNQKLAGYIHFHSTYFSIYIVFSITILVHYINNKKYSLNKFKPLVLLSILIFAFLLVLLAARMVIIAALILAGIFIFKNIFRKNKLSYILGGALIVLVFSVFLTDNYFKKRVQEMYNFDTEDLIGSNSQNGVTERIFIWKNALEVIKEKPIFGHGSGDVNLAFSHQYSKLLQNRSLKESKRITITSLKTNDYNAHNQYLQILIAFGITGLLFVLFLFFIFIRFAIKNDNRLYLAFLLLFMMCLFTEDLLDRQAGIVFFMFFNCLFLFHNRKQSQSSCSLGSEVRNEELN